MPFDFFSAGGIGPAPAVRRCPEGSIDYGHYRREAARERARALANATVMLTRGLRHTLAMSCGSMIRPRGSAQPVPDQEVAMMTFRSTLALRLGGLHVRHTADPATALRRVAAKLAVMIVDWRERARSRRALAAMDERMRRDIGISRFTVLKETSKPFWQP